ncbi:MAG: nuclear transport factor 2 family protein [Pseudomonadales bacterium]|nr:nuclear transport factor 2 family protein [Pseudomonadales bacterium]
MKPDEMLALMAQFRRAYGNADGDGLRAVVTDDFSWHQHAGDPLELPGGRVLVGVDALLEEVNWRREHWTDVSYSRLEERSAGDLLVQTFSISGREDGHPFAADAVDLYPVVSGRIAMKDTYWKHRKQ